MALRSQLSTFRGIALLLLAATLLLVAPPASSQTCAPGALSCQNLMCPGQSAGTSLGCTAKDVQITKIGINRNGTNFSETSCTGGTNLTVDLNVTVNFGSPRRYNVGVFLSQDGKSAQDPVSLGGASACTVATLPLGNIQNPFGPGTVPSPFVNYDTPANTCGDGSKADVPTAAYAAATGSGASTGTATFVIPGVVIPCAATAGAASGKLNIPFVVTWEQSTGTCEGPSTAAPGTGSKCSSPSGAIGDVDVQVLPQVTKTDNMTSISPGDTATYTIAVANTIGIGLTNFKFADSSSATLTSTFVASPTQPYFHVSAVSCSTTSGTCPAGLTPASFVQSASNLTIPSLPAGATMTFTVTGQLLGNPTGMLTNTASVTVSTSAATPPVITTTVSATDSDTIVYPSLSSRKVVSTLMDPVRGTANPLNIPGSVSQYTITLTNTGQGRVDNNTAVFTDAIPANTRLFFQLPGGATATSCTTGLVPVSFADGSTPSGLTFSAADLQYSADNGVNYTATPNWVFVPATTTASGTNPPGCYAANISHIKVNPKGRMAALSSFALDFRVYLQ